RPVDVTEIVVDDGVPQRRVEDDRLEEELVGEPHMFEEADDRGRIPEPVPYVVDDGPRQTPVRRSAPRREPTRDPPPHDRRRHVEMTPPDEMAALDPVAPDAT